MQPFSLTCFGVGDGWPCADRKHSSSLYRCGPTSLLIDCGEGASAGFKATGLSYDTIDRIFLSHLHADHCGGFFMLLQGLWLEQRRKRLVVHAPTEGIAPIRQMLEAALIFDELLHFRLRFQPLAHARPVRVEEVRVTPFHTTHLESLRQRHRRRHRRGFEAFCFLIEAGGRRLAHSADIGAVEDLAPLVRRPLDLLVCELCHCPAAELFAYLRDKPIAHIAFIHLARAHWADLVAIRRVTRRRLPGKRVSFPRDGEAMRL
jgi:ribonuclease BN (tRNA processing enzyme)